MLIDTPVRELLAAFASPDPTPGGGSAAALAASIGASLLLMVARLPKTRSNSPEDRAALEAAAMRLTGAQQQLADAIDADTAAYREVVAAYKLPKATDDQKRDRTAAVQRALRGATDVPLAVMRLSAAALGDGQIVARHGHAAAASDAGVAAALLRAGLEGARLNVEINLQSNDDQAYVDAVRTEVARLVAASA